jgi:sugar phosphate isomerase/epimerase
MELKIFCPRWGSENIKLNDFFKQAKLQGYNGIEYAIASDLPIPIIDDIFNIAAKEDMLLIAQHYDTDEADYHKHYDAYNSWLWKMNDYKPFIINSQTGKDFFSFEENTSLINEAMKFAQDTGIKVYHETHRNKFSFAAHITREYLQKMPDLQITLDASHWVCVAESFLENQREAMQLAIERTEHIHARVGYEEGPQVPDPRVPEWQHALNMHLNWWDKVVERKRLEGADAILTITPEFGPFPYMVSLPFTQQPITNQWDVNAYMMQILRERYS